MKKKPKTGCGIINQLSKAATFKSDINRKDLKKIIKEMYNDTTRNKD